MTDTLPPAYQEQEDQNNLFVPDDFKYSTKVISCEPQIRQSFTRRVYSILSSQILATTTFAFTVYKQPWLQQWILAHRGWYFISIFVSLASCIWLCLAPRLEDVESASDALLATHENDVATTRHAPWYVLNKRKQYILLSVFTLAESYSLSLVTIAYDSETVLSALMITCVVFIGVSLMAISPRFQLSLTSYQSFYYWLNLCLWLLIGIGLSSLIFGTFWGSSFNLIYGWVGAIVFSLYIFIDTQLIFRKVYANEEIKCAMMLYLDIINLFLSILRILSSSNDD